MAKKKPPQEEQASEDGAPQPAPFNVEEYRVAKAMTIWNYDDTGFDLTVDQQLFVRSYVIDRNPVAALRRINIDYDVPRLKIIASQYLKNPEVQGAIDHLAKRMMEHLEITAEKVQRRIANAAFFDPRSVMQFDEMGVHILNSRFWPDHAIDAVSSVKMGQNGIEIKFYDGLRAAEMLAKQLQLQPDDGQVTAEQARAAADAVINKMVDVFVKSREIDPAELDRERALMKQEEEDEQRRLN